MSINEVLYYSRSETPQEWLRDWISNNQKELAEVAEGKRTLWIGCEYYQAADDMRAEVETSLNEELLSSKYRLCGALRTEIVEGDMHEPCEWYLHITCYSGKAVLEDEEDETVVTNKYGGSQSLVKGDWTQLPFSALDAMAKVMHEGAVKYGERNYRKIPKREHVNHALRHLIRYCDYGDLEDLTHAFTRLAFALDINEVDK